MNDIEETYKTNDHSKNAEVLASSLKTLKLVAKVFAFLYLFAGLLFLMTPLAAYYFKRELVLIFEIYIPGLDYETTRGYIITNFLHFLFDLCGICGTFGFDLVFFMYYYHIVTLNGLMKIKLEEMEEFLLENDLKIPENAKRIQGMMRDIYRFHQKILKFVPELLSSSRIWLIFECNFRYITDSNELFSESCTIVTVVTTLSVTFSLFLLVTDSWIGGYALVMPFTVQLFINSLIGMIANIQV